MKLILKNIWFLPVYITLLISTPAFSQETPGGHAEVWNNVKAYWHLWAERDLDGFMEYFDKGFSGWNYDNPMHMNKEATRKWLTLQFQSKEVMAYDISAIDIKIHDTIAVVHYYYSFLKKDTQGKEQKCTGRKSDILMKQGDKWLLIADHGGHTSEKGN